VRNASPQDSAAVPINSPASPSPAKAEKRADTEADVEIKARAFPPNAGNAHPSGPGIEGISVNHPGVVRWNVDHVGVGAGWLDGDVTVFIFDFDLIVALEITGFFCFAAHGLDG